VTTKLPQELLRHPDRRVVDIAVGESAQLRFHYRVQVAPDLSVYLQPDAKVNQGKSLFRCISVRRDDAGYHTAVSRDTPLEVNGSLTVDRINSLILVETITVAG
jgi:hypothetical protein